MKDFARGCMRTYLILKEKARRWNEDKEIQALVGRDQRRRRLDGRRPRRLQRRSAPTRCKATTFDRGALGARGLPYEKLDQLTVELILGVR